MLGGNVGKGRISEKVEIAKKGMLLKKEKMKRKTATYIAMIVIIASAGMAELSAQHYFGIRGGAGSGSARMDPKTETRALWGLPSFGVSWKYYSKERALGGLEVDLMFTQMGYKELWQELEDPNDEESKMKTYATYQRKINTIVLPIAWQPHLYVAQRKGRIFLNLAVTFSYHFGSTEKYDNEKTGASVDRKYDMKLTRDNPFSYGLFGGGGIGWSFGRIEVVAEGRYYFGLGDMYRNPNKYKEVYELTGKQTPTRSPIDGLQVQFGVYYRLGKGGILAPRSKKEALRIK